MATKKGQFAVCGEWAKHLRKWGKREFWSSERGLSKKNLKKIITQKLANNKKIEDEKI
jgi:hypothetical protein